MFDLKFVCLLKKITSTCFVLYMLPKGSLDGYFKWQGSTILPVCSHFYFDEFTLSLSVFVEAAGNQSMDSVHAKYML